MSVTHELLNTLYVTKVGVYLKLENETVRVEEKKKKLLAVPLHHLGAIVVFGWTGISPKLLHHCAELGISVVWLDAQGRFKARMSGPTVGNVLLRRDQHETIRNEGRGLELTRSIVAGKIQNCRRSVQRSIRDAEAGEGKDALERTVSKLQGLLPSVESASSIDVVRGVEGEAARHYFETFGSMILKRDGSLSFDGRNRRPPRDPVNAVLSFLYTLLTQDCISGLETVGLDPQMGFLHGLRPGKPSLALDLMEEFRPVLADRLAITLLNRQQLRADSFEIREGGSVKMTDVARKALLVAYQERKKTEVEHPLLKSKVPLGLVPQLQARLMARWIRGEMEHYVPYQHK